MTSYAMGGSVPGNCGLGLLSQHSTRRESDWSLTAKEAARRAGGTGFFVTGFINTRRCKAVYDDLVKNYKLVYQSPVRLNSNSGRQFFFCVFDRGE